jgi:leucyl-tRNA synthetase
MTFDHRAIEKKWQGYWDKNKTFKAKASSEKSKYYILDMFPYVSGSGLHVGHLVGYTATDIVSRFKRQNGFNVLHPMGWDSFGLPTEQHAIRTGTHPAEITQVNIDNFRRQLKQVGFSYDWDREFATSDPKYYKWTQWIFTKLYEKGLAYEAEMPVNFCPALGTVLANEEVDNGKSKEGGFPVERRPLRQWVLKITEYAERLLEDLEELDWPEHLKKLQRNWIGKSEGAQVEFEVAQINQTISVFTTRPDTLFGATYMVLAPEHPLIDKITTKQCKAQVEDYKKQAMLKSDLERTELEKEKTGVFTGAFAINPVNGKNIPIWVSDYILMSYGTGAIMAVPAHDERDFAFAKKYDLPVVAVIDPDTKAHPELIPQGMSPQQVRQEVLAGNRCWTANGVAISSGDLSGLGVKDAISKITAWLEKEKRGKKAVNYKLRDWLFSRQRYWGEPVPILHFADGTKRALEMDELPLEPPSLSDFKPAADGQSPLAKVTDWVEINDPKTAKKAKRETNTMPQWAGSCWYYLRFCDPENSEQAWDKMLEKYWMPVDMYVGGVEHAVLHLLYARFWHKVLFDLGYVSTKEPFKTLRNQGLIVALAFKNSKNHYVPASEVKKVGEDYIHEKTGEVVFAQLEKMSKSKLNGVSPDEILNEFGADALRLYEMFMGPMEKEKIWNTDAVNGCRRFLNRFWEMATSEKVTVQPSKEGLVLGHKLIDGVRKDIDSLLFNTAIAKMMEFLNHFTKLDAYPKSVVEMATQALSPFAPHLAEEIWERLGHKESISKALFPAADPSFLVDESATYVVQINGKLRGRFDLPCGKQEKEILSLAKQDERIATYLEGKEIVKVIFVPDKLLNLVVK